MINTNELQTRAKITEQLPDILQNLHRLYHPLKAGVVADYIPELAQANPDWFGITVVTVDGQVYTVGDTSIPFTIQSISKPFVYGLALEDRGLDYVLERIGVEPTGEPFNEIIEHEEIQERQYNPMVNAGAIATTSLIKGLDLFERQTRLLRMFHRYTGRDVQVDQAVFQSKKKTDNLNRAIAYIMKNFGLIEGKIDDILDLYFQQCALMVNCRDLAVMAGTLANAGINPITGERALKADYVKNLISVMYTCGLYDFSGQWAYKVGLPAKSGLSGAIIGVVPNQMGIAVFSPPLGEHSKSLRGVKVFEALSKHLRLHVFDKVVEMSGYFPDRIDLDSNNGMPIKNDPLAMSQTPSYPQSRAVDEGTTNTLPMREALPKVMPKLNSAAMIAQLHVSPTSFITDLRELHRQYLPIRQGKIYVSEPDLVEINPDWFGICIVTVDGQVYTVGDWEQPFLIQSISKVFAYGMALSDWGRDYVVSRVDVEPTGDAYNSLIKVEENSKRPYNPMVNTGAIAITNLIEGKGPAHRLNRLLDMYRRYVGHRVFVDTPSLVSEQTAGDRNWAIAYLLRNFGMISGDIKQTLDLYLQQCSVIINCHDLAVMGATLANNGINPMTGEQAIHSPYVKDLLSIMFTCGMYDFAGEWVYKVGFPAKSGVGGGIIGVVPGVMGIAVFSPPLDKRGNSIRGIKVCEELSRRFGLHIFQS
ncbi:Glutaminase family [Coleofasciculus chthonoplastes PCC 7420]|uniref:Glutaminase n=2 Tax=Coleofasciculaceae TaxID=1892251 RepID=B4VK05_9CYAN|nr:Glutaminase family [Coleofasciculus chthonoplastes PCC 7420]